MWINTLCTGYIIAIFFCLIDFFFCFDPRVWKKLLKEKKVKFFLALRFFGMLFSGAVGKRRGMPCCVRMVRSWWSGRAVFPRDMFFSLADEHVAGLPGVGLKQKEAWSEPCLFPMVCHEI